MKSANLLHNWGLDDSQSHTTVISRAKGEYLSSFTSGKKVKVLKNWHFGEGLLGVWSILEKGRDKDRSTVYNGSWNVKKNHLKFVKNESKSQKMVVQFTLCCGRVLAQMGKVLGFWTYIYPKEGHFIP